MTAQVGMSVKICNREWFAQNPPRAISVSSIIIV